MSMKKILNEGVYDKGILKAIILSGGPGAGKSFVSGQIFGLIDSNGNRITTNLNPYGLKIVNPDTVFEFIMRREGIDMRDLSKMSEAEFEKYTGRQDTSTRSIAKAKMNKIFNIYKNGRIGIIYDGTGSNYENTIRNAATLKDLGYDVAMIYISTDLDVALERNRKRDRVLPDKLVVDIYNLSKSFLSKYQSYFGNNLFHIINNENKIPDKKISAAILKFVTKPVQNPIGKKWIADELQAKNRLNSMK